MQKAQEIKSNGLTLRGMLHVPDNTVGKVPAVAIYHGFKGHKVESHFMLALISKSLEKAGIASVRFDFGGSGDSDGNFEDMTPETELNDAKNILDFLRGLEFIDQDRIGICGFSMGGYVGGITAGDRYDQIKALCLLSPGGHMDKALKSLIENSKEIKEGCYDVGGLLLSRKAYEAAKKINHFERTSHFKNHACIIHGTADMSVPLEQGYKYKEILENAEFHAIEGADHTFTSYEWVTKVISLTTGFFSRTL